MRLLIYVLLFIVVAALGCDRKSMPDKSKFTGRWHYEYRKATIVLREDGFAEMSWPDKTAYKGTWYLPDDNHLVLRIVVPLNRPDIDDELNAEEMYYSLQEITPDRIVARQFDEEGVHIFTRIRNEP